MATSVPVFIHNRATNQVLDVDGGKMQPSTKVISYPKKESDNFNQKWIFTHDGFLGCAANPKLVLDIEGGGGAGSKLVIGNKKENDNLNQRWVYHPDEFLVSQGKSLVVDAVGQSPGSQVVLSNKKPEADTQKFYFSY